MRYSIAIAAFAGLAAAVPHYAAYPVETPEVPAATESCSTEVPQYPVETPSPSVPAVPQQSQPSYPTYPVNTPEVPSPEESTSCSEEAPKPTVPAVPQQSQPGYPTAPKPSQPAVPQQSQPGYPSVPQQSQPSVPQQSQPSYPVHTPEVPSAEETTSCLSSTTITITVPYPTGTGVSSKPVVPASQQPPYPSMPAGGAPYPSVPAGTAAPPAGTGYPTKTGGYVKPSNPPEFSGAASSLNVGGFVAGVGAFAAFFL